MNSKKITYSLMVMDLPYYMSSSTTFPSSFIKKHPRVIKQIKDNEIHDAMYIKTWSKGSVYSSYGNIISTNNPCIVKYANIVWLCVSNNLKNIKNQINTSNYSPTNGISLDGYEWISLFKIDNSDKGKYTKIPSYNGIIDVIKNTNSSFCTNDTNGINGMCSLYLNTGTTGTFIGSFSTDCSVCTTLSKSLTNTDISINFLKKLDTSNISLITNKEKLENIIKKSPVARTNFSLNSHTNTLSSGLSAGCIISANIDSSVLYTNMPLGLTIDIQGDGIGSGAVLEFVYSNIIGSTGTISGIVIKNRGEGYQSNIFANIIGIGENISSSLSNAISLTVPLSTTDISPMSSIFDIRSSFPEEVITLVSTTINPKASSINCNAYALLKNQIDDNLPSDITGIKFFTPGDEFTSNATDQQYIFNFIIRE